MESAYAKKRINLKQPEFGYQTKSVALDLEIFGSFSRARIKVARYSESD